MRSSGRDRYSRCILSCFLCNLFRWLSLHSRQYVKWISQRSERSLHTVKNILQTETRYGNYPSEHILIWLSRWFVYYIYDNVDFYCVLTRRKNLIFSVILTYQSDWRTSSNDLIGGSQRWWISFEIETEASVERREELINYTTRSTAFVRSYERSLAAVNASQPCFISFTFLIILSLL